MDESGLLPVDIIQGTFFVAGVGEEDFIFLNDEQMRRYSELYSSQAVQTAGQRSEQTAKESPYPPVRTGSCRRHKHPEW